MSLPTQDISRLPTAPVAGPTHSSEARGFDPEQLREHVQIVSRRLEPGQHVYRAGQPFTALFYVRLGSLKMCELAADGREQVTGFFLQGELVGAESIGLAAYTCDAIALETTEIWELPFPAVLVACMRIAEMQSRLTAALAEKIRKDRAWMLALGTLSAEQRVAAFLLDLASRYQALGFSGSHFILRMCRADIASYLALKHETVSRALGNLSNANCIGVQRREMRIVDHAGLRRIAGFGDQLH
ncbi:MAG: cyclic nucleotide-binding domain-containing protein [Rudaea sp.]